MRPTRQRSTRSQNKAETSGSSSGEEVDQKVAMNIINKLSNKYKKNEHANHKLKKKRDRKAEKPSGYEGDGETSTEQSDLGSQDLYDFDMAAEEDSLRLQLFPEEITSPGPRTKKTASNRLSSNKNKTLKENKPVKNVKPKKSAQKDVKPKTNVKPKTKNLEQKDKLPAQTKEVKKRARPFWENLGSRLPQPLSKKIKTSSDSKSKKVSKPIVNDTKTKRTSRSKSLKADLPNKVTLQGSFVDSGVFMSPGSSSLCSTGTPVGTPSILLAGSHSQGNTPAYGRDDILPPPSLSPVKRVSSTMGNYSLEEEEELPMDQGSPSLKSPSVSRTYSHISLSELPVAERKKKIKRKGRYSTAKMENWAAQMNEEFEEIESFELSIEG